jgi:hypothetical protein
MALDTNQQIAHDNDYAVGQALQTLQAAIAAAIPALTNAGATDSLSRVQALSSAIAPVSQAVINAMNSYVECGNL